jgi:hypothetical protein
MFQSRLSPLYAPNFLGRSPEVELKTYLQILFFFFFLVWVFRGVYFLLSPRNPILTFGKKKMGGSGWDTFRRADVCGHELKGEQINACCRCWWYSHNKNEERKKTPEKSRRNSIVKTNRHIDKAYTRRYGHSSKKARKRGRARSVKRKWRAGLKKREGQ